MNLIGFSHNYTKLHGQTHGKLIYVDIVQIKFEDHGSEWWEYDTEYRANFAMLEHDDRMLLKYDKYVRLVFLGNKGIPFTTYRKENDYKDLVGTDFVFKFLGKPIPEELKPPSKTYDVSIFE